jgi:hypothetical protein
MQTCERGVDRCGDQQNQQSPIDHHSSGIYGRDGFNLTDL